MKTFTKIGAAVAALLGTSSAFALNLADTNAAPVQLVVAGASAARDSFLYLLAVEIADPASLTIYQSSNANFRAVSGTLKTGTTSDPVGSVGRVLADRGIAGQNFTVYYRAEGGSIWGPGSIVAKQLNPAFTGIKAVDTTLPAWAGVTAVTPTPSYFGVAIPTFNATIAYNIDADSDSSGFLSDKQTQYGVSDVEPAMFTSTNWLPNTNTKFPAYSAAIGSALTALPKTALFGQTFGFIVSNQGPAAGLTNLSKQQLTSIFTSGGFVNWNKIPGLASGAIFKARREPGSGTQASAAAYLAGVNTGRSSYTFVVDNGNTIREFTSTGALNNYVGSQGATIPPAGQSAIGLAVVANPAPTGTHFVNIDGVAPDRLNVQNGTYDFAFELTTQIASGTAGNSLALAQSIDILGARAASVPDLISVFAIPSATNVPGSSVPGTVGGNRPVANGTRSGNSALPFKAQ